MEERDGEGNEESGSEMEWMSSGEVEMRGRSCRLGGGSGGWWRREDGVYVGMEWNANGKSETVTGNGERSGVRVGKGKREKVG